MLIRNERRRVFCNTCSTESFHAVLHEASQHWREDNPGGYCHEEHTDYWMLQCQGCDSVKLQENWSMPGSPVTTTYYPPAKLRRQPDWMQKWWLQSAFTETPALTICGEIYRALQNDQPHLAVMGVRAVLELVMIDKVGADQQTFAKNLEALFAAGHVSRLQKDRLKSVLDLGSATIHRGHSPSKEDINTCVDIMEHVIESLYIHEEDVKRMTDRVPPRQKADKA